MKNAIRSEAMHLYNYLKKSATSASDAMRQAWMVAKCEAAIRSEKVQITFKKISGEETTRLATVCAKFFEYTSKGAERAKNALQVSFFDLDANSFKSFTAANLVQYKVVA